MGVQEQQEMQVCPVCGSANSLDMLSKHEYRCGQCKLELAHLDVAANGVIRGVFGWLRAEGDTIESRYRVKSVLGKGGFGATYLIEDIRLNGKRRALKEVPELLFDEYETKLLSRLNHPSIPDIIDRSEAGGMVYLVLEFGGSRTLGAECKQYPAQRIPLAKLLPWMRQLCEVLTYLHSQDPPIIHRDLKPDNILLDENGRIMLIDFGIAKESKAATMTRTLGRAATHGFSPPEQAMGTGTDERSDIYALGATFYALLSGENPPAAHERVSGKELTPLTQLVPELPSLVEEAILQALDLNVNRRQQSVLEFSQALDSIDIGSRTDNARNTVYAQRTVLIGSTVGAAAIHPPSIKLPGGRITKSGTPSSQAIEQAQQLPRRAVLLPLTGGAVVLAALFTGVYLYLQKSAPEISEPAPPQTSGPLNPPIVPAAGPAMPNNAVTTGPSGGALNATNVGANGKQLLIPGNNNGTPQPAGSTAIDALKNRLQVVNPPPNPPIIKSPPIKPPPIKVRVKPKSDDAWLNEFSSSERRQQ